MSAIPNVSAGADVLESWGDAVADALNGAQMRSSATGNIANTQTQVLSKSIAANTLAAGDTYRIRAFGVCTSNGTNVVTIRARIGTTTLTGNIAAVATPTATASASADSFAVEAYVTVRSTGGSGTAIGGISIVGNSSQPFAVGHRVDTTTATVSVDTTTTNLVELTAVTAAAGTTVNFHIATIEKLRP